MHAIISAKESKDMDNRPFFLHFIPVSAFVSIFVEEYQIDDVKIRPEEMIPKHTQNTWEIVHISEGRGQRTIGDKTEPFMEGDLVVVPPGVPHCWHFDPVVDGKDGKVANIAVMVNQDWLARVLQHFPAAEMTILPFLKGISAFVVRGDTRERIAAILKQCVEDDESLRPLRIIECLLVLARSTDMVPIAGKRPVDAQTVRLEQIQIYVKCNYMRTITLSSAANHIGMSRSLFCAFFKKATGSTFITAVNDCRIEEACRQLANTSLSITEIANKVGFSDVAYFNRQFKCRLGQPPLQWRKNRTQRNI